MRVCVNTTVSNTEETNLEKEERALGHVPLKVVRVWLLVQEDPWVVIFVIEPVF
jgi:hypothetical protein